MSTPAWLPIAAGALAGLLAGALGGRGCAPPSPPPVPAAPAQRAREELPHPAPGPAITRDDEAREQAHAASLRAERVAGEVLALEAKVSGLGERFTDRTAALERAIAELGSRTSSPAAPVHAEPELEIAQGPLPAPPAGREPAAPVEPPAAPQGDRKPDKKREAEVTKRTVALERELRPLVERWYRLRDNSLYTCQDHVPGCKRCLSGATFEAGQKAWWDMLSPEGKKKMGDPNALFTRVCQGKEFLEARGRYIKVVSAEWLDVRLEERTAVARAHVMWQTADMHEADHETRWVLVKKRFYLATDGELGEQLLPR